MVRTRSLWITGLALTLFSITAMAQSVRTDYDHKFNLAKLKTYQFSEQNRQAGDPLAVSPLNDRRIHDAIDSQLTARGFENVTNEKPDFYISYYVMTRQALDIQDNRFGLFSRSGNINVNQVTEGTIVVVFSDTATRQEVWRGFVAGTIDANHLDKNVNKGIAKLVQRFVKDQGIKR